MNPFVKKRFWTSADVVDVAGGFGVSLDSRPLQTPAKAPLVVPVRDVAALIATEWADVVEQVDPTKMPVTRWANAAIDKVADQQADVVEMLASYGASDLLCYRAAGPKTLSDRQTEFWDPVLEWAKNRFDAPLKSTIGVIPITQPNRSTANLMAKLQSFDAYELAAVHDLVTISGSLVLALAISEKKYSAEDAWFFSRIDENWQKEQWGEDEAATATAEAKRISFLFADRMLQLLR